MDNTTQQNVIYFKDMIFAVVRRWKAVLAVAIALGLLLGGYKCYTGLKEHSRWLAGYPAQQAAYEEALVEYQKEKQPLEAEVARRQQAIADQQEYLENSPFLELDPNGYYEARFSIYVQTDYQILPDMTYQNPDETGYILSAYHALLGSPEALELMAEAAGTQAQYIEGLFLRDIPSNSNRLELVGRHPTKEGAQAMLKQIKVLLSRAEAEVNRNVGEHTLHFLEQEMTVRINSDVGDKQGEAWDELDTLYSELEEVEITLSELTEPAAPAIVSRKAVAKEAIIFAVLGGILGAALVAAWSWMLLLSSQKVFAARNLCERTGVKLLGCVAHKQPGNPIDRLALKLEGREFSVPQARAKVLACDIHHRCGGVKSLLVTGDGDAQQRQFLLEALNQAMPGVQVCDRGSILRSAEAVDALQECDAVLLIEQCGSSYYGNVAAQSQKIADYGKTLLGCILIGG